MNTTDEIILLTDEFTGLEYSWRKTGVADSTVNNVLTKNIGTYKYERIFEVADVRWWGIKGDGTDESATLNQVFSDIKDNKKVNEVAFYGLEKVLINSTINIQRGDLIIDGKNCFISSTHETDVLLFNIDNTKDIYKANNIHIKNFLTSNVPEAQTFLKAKESHYLRVTDCRFDGMKLGFDLEECYFTKLNAIYFHGTHQAFKFYKATNAFNVTNVKIHGGGIPSEIINTTTGGNISGCSFEDASGRLLIDRSFGINITGNYFEGHNENKVDTYIKLSLSARYENVAGINIAGNLFYTGAMQAIKLDNVAGISITGNYIGTLHALNLSGNGDSTQRNINYSGNAWRYSPSLQVGIPVTQASEYIGEYDGGRANASPEWNVPVIFTPQAFHARFFEDGDHQLAATAIDAVTTANYMTHTWQTNGQKTEAYLNGSVNLLQKKYFNASEANAIPIEPFGFGSTLGTLMLQNDSGQFAMFLWQRNISTNINKGYFKQVVNDLGVTVVHDNGQITITNGGTPQYLKAELKV
ncbi:hypothetical protein JET18_12845 [Chryseobacterium sp. L7]|uniref:Right handed beta helix domain-containing protein n=1 Tax=Chryseobacterium endalhagicum TaxID=2797638 RepID=A0ABS1QGM7_9FLAO|nr:hypothetical protein [Chryseobacterium endalhagicum]MBL1221731.1 hypothetical protein [Chryseobacterium endalhagicum]